MGLNYLGMLLVNINGIKVRPPWLHLRLNLHMALVCPHRGVLNVPLLWKACQLSFTHMNPTLFSHTHFHIAKMKMGIGNMINISPYLPLFPSLQISNWELHCRTPTFTTSQSTNETICKKEQLKVNLQDFIANFCSKNLKFMSNAPIISYLMITLNWANIIIFMRVWLCPLNNHEAKTFYANYSSKWLTFNSWTDDHLQWLGYEHCNY